MQLMWITICTDMLMYGYDFYVIQNDKICILFFKNT